MSATKCPLCGKSNCSCRDSDYGMKKSKSMTYNPKKDPPKANLGVRPTKGGYK